MEKTKKYLLGIFILLVIISASLILYMPVNTKSSSEILLSEKVDDNVLEKVYIIKEPMGFINGPIPIDDLKKFNKSAKEDLLGKTQDFILKTFGKPTYEVSYREKYKGKEKNKKAYIYTSRHSEEESDSSALFIVMENELVYNYTIDEFNGLSEDTAVDIFEKFNDESYDS